MKSLRRIAFRRLSIKSDSFFDLDFDDFSDSNKGTTSSFRPTLETEGVPMRDVFNSNLENQDSRLTRRLSVFLFDGKCIQRSYRRFEHLHAVQVLQ